MDEVVSNLSICNETLVDLYGPMYKYYPRQWVRLIGEGAKLSSDGGIVVIDFPVMIREWNNSYTTGKVTNKMANILMYIYAKWINKCASTISSTHAELLHENIILLISKFDKVKLNKNSEINPVNSVFNLLDRIQKQTYWKLHADITHGKNRYYQLRYNDTLRDMSLRHDLMVNDEGEPNYILNSVDFDWDFGDRLDDED